MNTTTNGSSCTSPFNPTAERIGKTFALCLITVVLLVGNFFLGLIVYRTKTMRTPINYFIVNMAMSDLMFSIVGFLLDITQWYSDVWALDGALGQARCMFVIFLYIFACISAQSLLLIAVDRFGAVVFPLRSPLIHPKQCRFFIAASWMVALGTFSPFLFSVKFVENSGKLFCRWWSKKTLRTYFFVMSVGFLCVFIAILIILYSITLYKLKSQKIPGEQSVNAQEQRKKRNRNVILKMAIAIVLAFLVCWMPYIVTRLLLNSKWNTRIGCSFLLQLYLITVITTRANCALNPLICFIFSGNFRQGLKALFTCCGAIQD